MFQSVISLIPVFFRILFMIALVVLFDSYAYQTIKMLCKTMQKNRARIIKWAYWIISIMFYVLSIFAMGGRLVQFSRGVQVSITGFFFAMFLAKLLMTIPLVLEDLYRLVQWVISKFRKPQTDDSETANAKGLISRKTFIARTSAGIGALTFSGLIYGVSKGAHDYKIHRTTVAFPHLPQGFKGLKIAQLSDIHAGSFWDVKAVEKGIQLLLKEQPDIIFFTGDLVNTLANEMTPEMIALFGQLKAPMGVFSILGNHDYGDYYQWQDRTHITEGNSAQSDKSHMSPMQLANLEAVKAIHKQMGWDLLLNENRILQRGGDAIALIGVENYGAKGRFARYGVLSKAYEGTQNLPFKILLSHDPSHWDAQVRKSFKDIDLTFSGHTHGAQLGIETANFKWSPIQLMYKQWAGLYQEDQQYIYVNRGFGYLGYPGRLGIRPEIGIITLA
jgi:predicted MPP superfamily phosphohydrolase